MRERDRQSTREGEDPLGHRPFRNLKKLVGAKGQKSAAPLAPKPEPPRPAAAAPAEVPAERDEELFLREIGDVKRLDLRDRQRVAAPPPAQPGRPLISEDAEAMAELADLVTGKAPFDLSDSDEYLEGSVKGLDPRIVRRLRRGEFAHQAHLDLHRMTADEARSAVDRFLFEAYRAGRRCVLIIHGRGLNSRDQIPVLKNRLTGWLARGQWARLVLAFASARQFDGGAGALYVLLRRERGSKKEIEVLNGAKS